MEKRESYVDTRRGTNQKKGSDITKPIDLCCESSEDEIQTENVSNEFVFQRIIQIIYYFCLSGPCKIESLILFFVSFLHI